jgi:hypothetical protein
MAARRIPRACARGIAALPGHLGERAVHHGHGNRAFEIPILALNLLGTLRPTAASGRRILRRVLRVWVGYDRSDAERLRPLNVPQRSSDIGWQLCAAGLPFGAVCWPILDGQLLSIESRG